MSMRTLVANLPLLQLSLTSASIGMGIYGLPLPFSSGKEHTSKLQESFDARHYDLLTELITQMYSGRGCHHSHVHLDDSVTFSDPVAICNSADEVHEAFRILRILQPKSLHPPTCVDVEPRGSYIVVKYALHQHYGLLNTDLHSEVTVEVQLEQSTIYNAQQPQSSYLVPESNFLVSSMKEEWNGNPLPRDPIFWIVRRMNGILSWHIFSRLVP